MNIKKNLVAAALFTFLLSGCASIPPSIQGNSTLLASQNYTAISSNLPFYLNKQVRLGGRVLNVINHNNETLFEVAVLPLDKSARPEIGSAYQGRIMVRAAKFIEPLTLKDHLVTVLGTVTGSTTGKVGQADYNFVTLQAIGYQIWRVRDDIVPVSDLNYGFGPYWQSNWNPAYGPYYPAAWGEWGWYPPEVATYQIQKEVVR